MRSRYTAILLTIGLAAAFVAGLFIQPTDSQANPGTGWKAEYFNNKNLSGTPVLTVTEDQINMNWAGGAPYPGLPNDNFSARWTASPTFAAGTYRFRVGADDGIRLYIDDVLIINDWGGGPFRTTTRDVQLSAGQHNLKVEYYEAVDLAGVLVDWSLVTGGGTTTVGPTATPLATIVPTPSRLDDFGRPYAHVATGVLNVRANPSIGAARLTQIYLYDKYPILGISADGRWYLIQLRDGRSGWVAERYIYRNDGGVGVPVVQAAASSESERPAIEVTGYTSSELKIRTEPRRGEIIGIIPLNGFVRVLGRNAGGSWYYVSYEGIEGWAFSPYVVLTNGRVMDIPVR